MKIKIDKITDIAMNITAIAWCLVAVVTLLGIAALVLVYVYRYLGI